MEQAKDVNIIIKYWIGYLGPSPVGDPGADDTGGGSSVKWVAYDVTAEVIPLFRAAGITEYWENWRWETEEEIRQTYDPEEVNAFTFTFDKDTKVKHQDLDKFLDLEDRAGLDLHRYHYLTVLYRPGIRNLPILARGKRVPVAVFNYSVSSLGESPRGVLFSGYTYRVIGWEFAVLEDIYHMLEEPEFPVAFPWPEFIEDK